ncbi:MAG: HAMP domain-containing protein [Ramlibacter sp.]|nr:HAMP domain-containing protein [Ramlibacter sp.]
MRFPLRLRSIRHKLNWVVLVTTFVALSLAALALVVFDLRSYQQTWERDLQTQADLLGMATEPALTFNDSRAARENLALLRARPNVSAAAVYRPDGTVFATYARDASPLAPPPVQAEGVRVDEAGLVAFKRIASEGELLGTVYLRADDERLDRLRQYLGVMGVVVVASLALALLLSNGLLSSVMQPILAVSDVAGRVTAGHDYSLRAVRTSNDEVGQVVDAFNSMLDELAHRADTLAQAHEVTLNLNAELEDRVRRRTAQLERVNRELEAFSYSASHDLRSPLQVIDSFSSLLEKSAEHKLDERGRHYLNRIRFNVRLMSELIDALLALAHVSRVALRREPVDLTALATAAVEQCREREPQRVVEICIAHGLTARADPALIKQVMQNLVGNAWKFTARVPQARIEVGCRTAGDAPPEFFVRDNGAGFDMAYADKLFGAFQRLHSPAEFPGTGVGLATVQRIVLRHDGRIRAESKPGEGATFFFTLEPPLQDVPGGSPRRIFVTSVV